MSKVLSTYLTGGLGNQLFKSIGTLHLASMLSRSSELNLSWYQYVHQFELTITPRQFELDYFPNIISSFSKLELSSSPKLDLRKNQLMRKSPKSFRNRMGYYTDEEINEIDDKQTKVKLLANFESVNYLPDNPRLQYLLEPKTSMSSWQQTQLENIGSEEYIGIHVRMGDYLKFPNIYNILTSEYYCEALSNSKYRDKLPVVLFSDEPDKAQKWLGKSVKVTYSVDVDPSLNSAECMLLLSKSKTIITAHSTFSWWAARIGWLQNVTQEVMIPKRFFANSESNSSNFLVSGWKQC